jgi:hypothetical protein
VQWDEVVSNFSASRRQPGSPRSILRERSFLIGEKIAPASIHQRKNCRNTVWREQHRTISGVCTPTSQFQTWMQDGQWSGVQGFSELTAAWVPWLFPLSFCTQCRSCHSLQSPERHRTQLQAASNKAHCPQKLSRVFSSSLAMGF